MKHARFFLALLVVLAVGYFLVTRPPKHAPTGDVVSTRPTGPIAPNPALTEEITIGAMLPLTGERASLGIGIQKAIQLATEEINGANGIGGKKLIVAYEDGRCDGTAAATAAQKLAGETKVPFIIGGACSSEVLGSTYQVNDGNVVAVSPSATAPEISTEGGPYVFRFAPSEALSAQVAAKYARTDLKAKRAAVISDKAASSQLLRKAFVDAFKKQGGTVALDETYAESSDGTVSTVSTEIQPKLTRAKAEVVYVIPGTAKAGAAIVAELREGEHPVPVTILGSDALFLSGTEGVYGFAPFVDMQNERMWDFVSAYAARYGSEPEPELAFAMANAYSIAYLGRDLMEKDGPDGQKMQQTMTTLIRDWAGGALPSVTLDRSGDPVWTRFTVRRIEGGAAKDVKTLSL